MGDVYRFPVFFAYTEPLPDEQLKRIENYFRVRRRSGGGECGSLRTVADQVYSVAFKHQREQQAVLQRSEHVVGDVAFTVRDCIELCTSTPVTAPVQQSQQSVPAPTPPPSGEEHEKQLDSYLLRYLKECPEAGEALKRDLASVACSAQLYPDEGRVLVRSLAPNEVRNWKAEADKVFDGYLCHYEADALKVKALLESCRSSKATDDVKVYTEVGMAVVVGERSQVNARLMQVEDSRVRRGSRLNERQTTTVRLGQAKLRLLWGDVEQGLGRDFPGVKVTQGNAGQLVLEGPVEEILKAGEWISGKESLVLERKVSDVSPHFLAFLKKAYGGPGTLGDFLGAGDKLEVELRDTELRFFSFSDVKLDDTENALRANIKDVKVHVPNCSAVPSALQEMLKSRTDEMNKGSCRAQVVFGPDSAVFLQGHTSEVEELSEMVTQFIRRYFQSPTGIDDHCTSVGSYSLRDGLQVLVCQGDITMQDADALVNAANEDLSHGGGVAAALSKAGGPEVQRESKALVKQTGKIPTGDVVVTTGGNLKCKVLLHAVGPVGGKSGGRERALLMKTVQSALSLAETMEFQSIAMPCISSGVFGVPVPVCAEAIVTAVKEFASEGGRSLSKIILIDNRGEVVRAMQEACDHLLQGMNVGDGAPSDTRFQMDASIRDTTTTPADGFHLEIVQGTIESQQVDAVVSPMVGQDPLSTRVGHTLAHMAGSQLTARYRMEAGEDMFPGEAVLVDGLAGLPFGAVFFLNLIPWDDDKDGGAVEVLKVAINNFLTSCEKQGFGSVALPVLGSGMALRFPDSVVARVLLMEVYAFGQNRHSRTPLSVRVIIHPDDDESHELFKSVQQDIFAKDIHQPDQVSTPTRIVLLGKTGSGKSNLANTIFGETLFETNDSANSGTSKCQAETRSVNGRSLTLIDTPGFFDAGRPEEELKPEIVKCITECSPGPHAFLIVLKVEKFTHHEEAVIEKICQYFSEDALKYAVVVFTHGHDLRKGMRIEEFVSQNKNLSKVVKRCGGRCHVVDNKHWNNKVQNNYRSNQLQVEELLKTIDKLVMENNGGYYVNKMMEVVEKEIRIVEDQVRLSMANLPVDEIRKEAKRRVSDRLLIQLAGTGTGVLLGAFFGLATMVGLVITALKNSTMLMSFVKRMPAVGGAAAVAAGGAEATALTAVGVVAGVTTAGLAVAGGAIGGSIGYNAAEKAETPWEAVEMAANAVINTGKDVLKMK